LTSDGVPLTTEGLSLLLQSEARRGGGGGVLTKDGYFILQKSYIVGKAIKLENYTGVF